MNRRLYALHRFIGAIAFLQLAVWTVTGGFFTLFDIDEVRGRTTHVDQVALPAQLGVITPATALAVASSEGMTLVDSLELKATPRGLFYFARRNTEVVRLDARTGRIVEVDAQEAIAVARGDQPGNPEMISVAPASRQDVAYRGKPLPAWRVRLADAKGTDVYVDASTGAVTARRGNLWRTYDFLWSLHIMDYGERENFHHPLITGAAALAFATVVSGVVLWFLRLRRWLRARRV